MRIGGGDGGYEVEARSRWRVGMEEVVRGRDGEGGGCDRW